MSDKMPLTITFRKANNGGAAGPSCDALRELVRYIARAAAEADFAAQFDQCTKDDGRRRTSRKESEPEP